MPPIKCAINFNEGQMQPEDRNYSNYTFPWWRMLGMCQLCIDDPSIHSAFPGANHDFQQCIEKVSVAFVFRKNATRWFRGLHGRNSMEFPEKHLCGVSLQVQKNPKCHGKLSKFPRTRMLYLPQMGRKAKNMQSALPPFGKSQDNARLGDLSCIFMYAIYLRKTWVPFWFRCSLIQQFWFGIPWPTSPKCSWDYC